MATIKVQSPGEAPGLEPQASQRDDRRRFGLRGLVLLLSVGFCPSGFAQPATNATLDATLAGITRSERRLPFKTVIAATTGHRVLDFDTNNPAHVELRRKILRAAALAGERARAEGIATARANEAGNHMEPFVRAALAEADLPARVPTNSSGRAQATGYPDIELTGAVPCYLELKTYNATTANTTQRTFYYSPSTAPKVTRDALHLLLAFELETVTRQGRSVFVPARWKLLTLQELEVELKFEFNQSNRGLYGEPAAVLDEDTVR
jgi:hypothetical protein